MTHNTQPCEACAHCPAASEATRLPDIVQTGEEVAAKAAGFPGAVASHDASTHLTEWDETVAVETRGGAEASMETLCDVLGLGCQWADFARRTCV